MQPINVYQWFWQSELKNLLYFWPPARRMEVMTRAHMESHAPWISRNVAALSDGWDGQLAYWIGWQKLGFSFGMNLGTISTLGGWLYCPKDLVFCINAPSWSETNLTSPGWNLCRVLSRGVVCLSDPRTTAILPCRHLCLCEETVCLEMWHPDLLYQWVCLGDRIEF